MAKKNNNVLVTVLILLLIIPVSFGIYYGIDYIIKNDVNDGDDSDTTNKLDVYVGGQKMVDSEYNVIMPDVGYFVLVEFKKPNSTDYYNGKMNITQNTAATESLTISDNFDSEKFVATKIVLREKKDAAKILFFNEDYSFQFTLLISSEYIASTYIDVPDVIFFG